MTARQRFLSRYVAAGVPRSLASSTWSRLSVVRGRAPRRLTPAQLVRRHDAAMAPLLARYRAALGDDEKTPVVATVRR